MAPTLVLGGWCLLTYGGFAPPDFLPSPSEVVRGTLQLFLQYDLLDAILVSTDASHCLRCSRRRVALPLGVLMGAFEPINRFFEPIMAPLRYMPISAFIPLLILWFGIYEKQKIAFLFLGVFVYLLPVVVTAIRAVPEELVQTARTLGASKAQVVWTVLLPPALPEIFDSFRVMNAISWTYVILAEAVNPEHGLGYMVELARTHQKASWSFAGLLVIGGIGLLTDVLIRTDLERCCSAGARSSMSDERTEGRRRRPGSPAPSPSPSPTAARRRADLHGAGRRRAAQAARQPPVGDVRRPLGPATEAVRDVSFDIVEQAGRAARSSCSSARRAAASRPSSRRSPACSRPRRARCCVDGKPVTGVGRDRGMVFQAYTSFGWLTVRDNVEYGLQLHGVPQGRAARAIRSLPEGRRARRVRRPLPQGALGRHEAAGGDRPHAHQPAAARADGRAVRRPRSADALGDAVAAARRRADARTTRRSSSPTTSRRRSTSPTPSTCSPPGRRGSCTASTCPYFAVRDVALKSAAEFRAVEKQLLDLLYAPQPRGT